MIDSKKVTIKKQELARRKRILLWTVFVILINFLQVYFKIWEFQVIAMIGTVYALYRIVVFDNNKNRYSSKYYDWAGQPLSRHHKKK